MVFSPFVISSFRDSLLLLLTFVASDPDSTWIRVSPGIIAPPSELGLTSTLRFGSELKRSLPHETKANSDLNSEWNLREIRRTSIVALEKHPKRYSELSTILTRRQHYDHQDPSLDNSRTRRSTREYAGTLRLDLE